MSVAQVTIRLTSETKAAFERYCDDLGFGSSEVLRLLIAREYMIRRLEKLKEAGTAPRKARQPHGAAVRLPKITAHFSSAEQVERFDAYATRCNLNRDAAGAWLVGKELNDSWLRRALSWE